LVVRGMTIETIETETIATIETITTIESVETVVTVERFLCMMMTGEKNAAPRHEFYYYYRQNSLEAVQRDYWKLVLPHENSQSYRGQKPGNDGWPGKYGTEKITSVELYDLRRDPGEWYNVAEYYPEKVKELEALAEKAREDLGDDITKTPGANRRKIGSINE